MARTSTTIMLISRMQESVFKCLLEHKFIADPVAGQLDGWAGQVWGNYFVRLEENGVRSHLAVSITQSDPIEVIINIASTKLTIETTDEEQALQLIFDFCQQERGGASVAVWNVGTTLISTIFGFFPRPFRLSKGKSPDETKQRIDLLCRRICTEIDRKIESCVRLAKARPVLVR